MELGFNSSLYMEKQTEKILERIEQSNNKLYLEFGGKLFDDFHAARVLPGFDANSKIKLLTKLKDQAEMIFCISAGDIERNKIRADFGITYGAEVIRLIDNMRDLGIQVNSVVITQYEEQLSAKIFHKKLVAMGERVYIHRFTKGYPTDVATIVSDEGYGQNPYIKTTKPLVVITAPGPSSGKLATCLCQLYHEYRRGICAGYAKFETFPVWNLPLKHPVNLAYEAATADLKDVNMLDSFHLEAYGEATVNYNRDIEVFPVVKTIMNKISNNRLIYQSPTDMGVNMVGYCINNDEVVGKAAKQEIIRRYFNTICAVKSGQSESEILTRLEFLMSDLGLKPNDRSVVTPARVKSELHKEPAMAMMLENGEIITSKTNSLLSASSALILNAIKVLASIDDKVKLLSPNIIEPIIRIKKDILFEKLNRLSIDEVLIALSMCTATSPIASIAVDKLNLLKGLEVHSSHILSDVELITLKKLGLNVTFDPIY